MVVALLAFLAATAAPGASDAFSAARGRMVLEIEEDVRFTRQATGKAALSPAVMNAMRTIPRHQFVPEALQKSAYANRPLPIGHGQTISQPYIVALMTDLLRVGRNDVVLEVGTGSGYQAAVLSPLVKRVYTVEVIEPLETRIATSIATDSRPMAMRSSVKRKPQRRERFISHLHWRG